MGSCDNLTKMFHLGVNYVRFLTVVGDVFHALCNQLSVVILNLHFAFLVEIRLFIFSTYFYVTEPFNCK